MAFPWLSSFAPQPPKLASLQLPKNSPLKILKSIKSIFPLQSESPLFLVLHWVSDGIEIIGVGEGVCVKVGLGVFVVGIGVVLPDSNVISNWSII
jgi:hypothetical protein